jgi:hypothetical protein
MARYDGEAQRPFRKNKYNERSNDKGQSCTTPYLICLPSTSRHQGSGEKTLGHNLMKSRRCLLVPRSLEMTFGQPLRIRCSSSPIRVAPTSTSVVEANDSHATRLIWRQCPSEVVHRTDVACRSRALSGRSRRCCNVSSLAW